MKKKDSAHANSSPADSPDGVTLEAALSRLAEIVAGLEANDSELEKSLALFEEGVRLLALCQGKISKAEQRVSVLKLEAE